MTGGGGHAIRPSPTSAGLAGTANSGARQAGSTCTARTRCARLRRASSAATGTGDCATSTAGFWSMQGAMAMNARVARRLLSCRREPRPRSHRAYDNQRGRPPRNRWFGVAPGDRRTSAPKRPIPTNVRPGGTFAPPARVELKCPARTTKPSTKSRKRRPRFGKASTRPGAWWKKPTASSRGIASRSRAKSSAQAALELAGLDLLDCRPPWASTSATGGVRTVYIRPIGGNSSAHGGRSACRRVPAACPY